jgi:rare lipoprotein A
MPARRLPGTAPPPAGEAPAYNAEAAFTRVLARKMLGDSKLILVSGSSHRSNRRAMYLFPVRRSLISIQALWVLSAGCWCLPAPAGIPAQGEVPPKKIDVKAIESGIASWHDPSGSASARRTASERPWSGSELIAAHKSLPLGTRVRVFNLSNGREVVVVITDRGPYRRGRIIDVSRSAAQQLGLIQSGTARVRLEMLKPGAS